MNKLALLFVALGAFAVGAVGTWLIMPHGVQAPASSTAAGANTDKKVLYWYDPMVPQQHFDAPGKSPFMDMQLVPKYAGDETSSDNGTVRIDSRLTQNLGVRTARAERSTLTRPVRATGTLALDDRAVTVVQSRVAGIVEKLWVRAPLSAVKRGDALVTLIAPDWTAAQEEYLSLRRAKSEGLEALRAAARQRLALLGMDEEQIRTVDRSGHAQTRITISAPRDGIISDLPAREGATVMAGSPLLTVTGLDTVWMNAAITEVDSGRVTVDAPVHATFTAFPGETFDGKVETLLPDVDATTRTQKARIVLPNPQHRLAPGMFASIEIAPAASATQTIVIPSEAVIATGTRNVVIVASGPGKFRAQEVRLGEEADGKTAILAGVNEGDVVVLSGQFLIDSEASLSGTLARLEPSTAAAPSSAAKAEGADAPTQHLATGRIEQIDGGRVTIATDAIPSLGMDAMTMSFIAPAQMPASPIRAGHRVSFSFFRNAKGEFEISQIAVLDAPSAKSKKP